MRSRAIPTSRIACYRSTIRAIICIRAMPAIARWVKRSRLRSSTLRDLLGQGDDDARGASHVAQSVDVLVLNDLADELTPVSAQPGDGLVDAVDGEHDAAEAEGVGRRDGRVDGDQLRIAELRQLEAPMCIWRSHHDDVDADAFD